VVNDGSTDATAEILADFPGIMTVTCPKNRGKGWALRTGFRFALENGFQYAITIDSDGQHYADDIPIFLEKIEKEPGSLIVGARNMHQDSVPGTSSFGHKFSVFWYRIETGMKLPDIQSGYRLYPLERISEKRFYSKKYEFEVEVLVRSAWHGIPVTWVPVKVWYAPKESRVSHFRKFRDFSRVSLMNTILVFMALLWERPFQFAKGLRKKTFRGFLNEYVINSQDSNARLAWSVALGLFIGVTPLWGWQMMIAFGVAYALKLNKFVCVAACNISIPPFLPLIVFASYFMGGLVLEKDVAKVNYVPGFRLEWLKENLLQYVIGSLILGVLLAVVMGFFTYFLLSVYRKKGIPEKKGNTN
jgi:uncharacterized protein (DUF2062 family)